MIRWLLGDQLGPHFDDGGPILIIEARSAFGVRPTHRLKAHLLLSAMRHRAAELGDRVTYVRARTYGEGLASIGEPIEAIAGGSHAIRRLARTHATRVLPERGFLATFEEFTDWADGRGGKRLLLDDWYRHIRASRDLLMESGQPIGGRWSLDAENRQRPPRTSTLGLPEPWWPVEDDIDAQVRADLDSWQRDGLRLLGRDGPRRFAVTRDEAQAALADFTRHRLAAFGPFEDAMLDSDPVMAHSMLSAPMNLGLLHPQEVIDAVLDRWCDGDVPLSSVEGFVRQVAGWREYVRHLYFRFGEAYEHENALQALQPLPEWFANLDADVVEARCLHGALHTVRDWGWAHHIIRLMVLGNWALQRGYDPRALTTWFTGAFVDAYPWVMAANVIGMSQYADGGRMATKPYASGGAYLSRMSDSCKGCRYRPEVRVGEQACPFTAGYWAFLDRNHEALRGNHRMAQPLAGLARLADRHAVVAQENARGSSAP